MRMLLVVLILVCGCCNSMRTQARLGVLSPDPVVAAKAQVQQTTGRDAMNFSPSLAVSGGGGVLFLITLAATWNWTRTRRALKAMVGAVEQLEEPLGGKVKRNVAREALAAGVADNLHAAVRRWGKTPRKGAHSPLGRRRNRGCRGKNLDFGPV